MRALVIVALLAGARVAAAQDEVALPEPIESPQAEGTPALALDPYREIDLANVVTSAAKGVTTVQEAPSIVTIITSDDIKARGFKWIAEALSSVPGWVESAGIGNQLPTMMVRG